MTEQAKFQRMLEMLMLLTSRVGCSIQSFAERFDMSERTAYRYLNTFKDAGFIIDKNGPYFQLDRNRGENKKLNDLLHFSEEEAYILSKAIQAIDEDNLIKTNLSKKLYSLYDFDRVANTIIKKEHSENVHNLLKAIKNKRMVILKEYKSSKSSVIRDRMVEPFNFTYNYISVWCYDPETRNNKLFKTARVKDVEVLNKKWENESKHNEGHLDVFRISSYEKKPVKLKLSLMACNLLIEEYPMAEEFITQAENHYIFDGWVSEWDGVGRFVMGLIDEIEVIKPAEFKKFLDKKIRNKNF